MTWTRPKRCSSMWTGAPRPGVGPHDVAHRFGGRDVPQPAFVKNKVLEFVGPGMAQNMSGGVP